MCQESLEKHLGWQQGKKRGTMFCIFCYELGKSFECDKPSELDKHEKEVHGIHTCLLEEREKLLRRIAKKMKGEVR